MSGAELVGYFRAAWPIAVVFRALTHSTTKLITVVVSVLLTGVAIATTSIAAALVAAILLVFSFAWSPRGYSLQGRSILVTRLAGNACIPLDGIRELRRAKADDFRGCIRLFGNGGVFGYYLACSDASVTRHVHLVRHEP